MLRDSLQVFVNNLLLALAPSVRKYELSLSKASVVGGNVTFSALVRAMATQSLYCFIGETLLVLHK
jgi:hypothetical protein